MKKGDEKMNLNKKMVVSILLFFIFILSINSKVFAQYEFESKVADYTEEYKKWIELPEEIRNETMPPRKFKINQNEKQTKSFFLTKSNYLITTNKIDS